MPTPSVGFSTGGGGSKWVVRSRIGLSIPVPKHKFNSNSSAFHFGREVPKRIVEKGLQLFELEVEVQTNSELQLPAFPFWNQNE